MRKIWPIFLALLMLLLVGCQTATPEEPVPTKTAAPTAEPTMEPVVKVDYCLSCHTDKAQLIDTARPEEVVEEESSGVG